MKILFISQYYPPEMGALASRASELCRIWSEMGNEVTVLTGFPNYPSGIIPEEYKTKEIDNNEVKKDQATIKKSLRKSSKSSLEN